MYFAIVFIVVLFGTLLTFFSGFGLGTILLPVFSIFFPIKTAIFATAIVHISNSIFKFIFLKKYIKWKVILLFGTPAIIFAFMGSFILSNIEETEILYRIELFGKTNSINTTSFLIACLIILFTLIELFSKHIASFSQNRSTLIIGGILSGFFGGLSGHQGALRSLFLKKVELKKEEFLATSTFISLCIDISRILVYMLYFSIFQFFGSSNSQIIVFSIFAAFVGVFIGTKILKKINLTFIHYLISIMLILFSLLMLLGFI